MLGRVTVPITTPSRVVQALGSIYVPGGYAVDNDCILEATNLLNDEDFTLDGDVPVDTGARRVRIVIVDTTPGITAGTVRVVGTGSTGQALQEDVDIGDGDGTYLTTGRFLTVTQVLTLDDVATLGGAGDETITVGVAADDGVQVRNDGRTTLAVQNTNGSGRTVSILVQRAPLGLAVTADQVTIPGNGIAFLGHYPTGAFNVKTGDDAGFMYIDISAGQGPDLRFVALR